MRLNARTQHLFIEAHTFKRGIGHAGLSVARANRHPNARRHGVGQLVKCERRHKADNALRHNLARLGQNMICVVVTPCGLIKPATELENKPLLFHAGDGRGGDPCLGQL